MPRAVVGDKKPSGSKMVLKIRKIPQRKFPELFIVAIEMTICSYQTLLEHIYFRIADC